MTIQIPKGKLVQSLRDMHVPNERTDAVQKHLARLLQVDDEDRLTAEPCRFTADKETRGIAVIEAAGGGKTTAIRTVLQSTSALKLNPETGLPRYLEIQIPSPATHKSVGLAILEATGMSGVSSTAKAWEIWGAVRKRLGQMGIKVLWLDEAQDLVMAQSANETETTLRTIKTLMLPVLPLIEGESTVSWCSRLGPFHAGLSGPDFLKLMQISRQSVVDTTDDCIGRLADLTGIAADRIRVSGVQRVGEARFKHGDEVFGMRFALRTHTTFCPACLLEDADPAGPSAGRRVGRIGWMFSPVRTCPRHGLVLHRRPNSGFHEHFQDMTLVAPDDAALEKLAGDMPSANTSALQDYVMWRLTGALGHDWLDTQDIDQATKACEMLGACLVFGAHTNLERLSIGDWAEAGSAGFEAARDGVDGLRKALDEISRESFRRSSKGGPQAAFGRIYQWLQFKKSKTDPGPIRDVVREFVLDTMSIDPGNTLFGRPVDARRRHSLASLSRSTGVHQATLRRALKLTGVLPADVDADDRFTVDAGQGERLADRIHNSIPISKVPEYLNCNRTQAQMLVKRGIVSQLVPDPGRGGGVLTKVAVRDLDDFISRFRAHGTTVRQASDGMVDAIVASEVVRRPVMDIVQLVLDRKLTSLELLSEDSGFRSVLVSPDEVRAVISDLEGEIGLSAHDVAARLGIFTSGVTHLRTNVDRSGRPFLRSLETVASSGTVRHRFAEDEVQRFQADYVALADLAKTRGKAPKVVAMELRKLDIKPIMRRELLNAAIYRRADL